MKANKIMRLSFIKAAGFRGIKNKVDIGLPAGFAVITGRNGTGKSTLCDALEFVLTGTLERYVTATEDKESIGDYLWWRGEGDPLDRYVTIGFVDEDGNEFEATRTPEALRVSPAKNEFFNALGTTSPLDLANLVRTTVLRDETIAELALDTTEPQRFTFTKAALGVSDFTELETKAQEVVKVLDARLRAGEIEYRTARSRVNDLIASASEFRAQIAQFEDVSRVERSLRELLADQENELPLLVSKARSELGSLRLQIEDGSEILREWREINEERKSSYTAESKMHQQLQLSILELEKEYDSVNTELMLLDEEVRGFREEEPRWSDLAQLNILGSRIGLEGDNCPLCGSHISHEAFDHNIAKIKDLVEKNSTTLNGLVEKLTELRHREWQTRQALTETRFKLERRHDSGRLLDRREKDLRSAANKLGLPVGTEATFDVIEGLIDSKREQAAEIAKLLSAVEASRLAERLTELERQVDVAQQHSSAAETRARKLRSALSRAKDLTAEISRSAGEIVDEQLSALSPLLSELFFRLRPHLNWLEVNYHLRGDVRHFLSFRVGDDLNPRFLFSSGQRRAAGLAFLLSVHLSRPWCLLQSLVLDDPIQHVDDYRALHLVEVLTGIRRLRRQIICTVEDQQLADLLCRRLRSSEFGDGALIEMGYSLNDGVEVARETAINPLPEEVLLPAKVG
jgi:chromosome segregation protein